MILPIQHAVRRHMTDGVRRLYDIPVDDPVLAAIAVEVPPRRALGDLSVPLAFELARRLRKAPRAIAQEIVGALGQIEGFTRIEAAPNGYVNFFLERRRSCGGSHRAGAPHRRQADTGTRPSSSTRPSIRTRPRTSATCATPRSAIRSSACSASAALRLKCRTTSTTPAFRSPTWSSASAISTGRRSRRSAPSPTRRASTTTAGICTPASPSGTGRTRSASRSRSATLHDIEHGGNENADIAAFIADRIVRCHLKTMARMNVGLRPPHVGGRHPAAAVLGAGVRGPEGEGRRLSADRRPAGGLLGDADRG